MVTIPIGAPSWHTGRWWTPRSIWSSVASNARVWASTVTGSGVMMVATGASGSPLTATTFARRSRSVKIPTTRPASTTTSADTRSLVMICAASRMGVSGPTVTASRVSSSPTGVPRASPPDAATRTEARSWRMRSLRAPKKARRAGCPAASSSNTSRGISRRRVSAEATMR